MKKIRQLGAIAMILGMIAGCNLTLAPPSSLPRVSPKPGIEKPRQKPAPTTQPPIASATNNRNLLLGNPSNAAPSVASPDNYMMVKPQFVLSYNSKTRTANWVSWQLNRSWIGAAPIVKTTSALIMPNDVSVKGRGWQSFRVSVKQVERETGLNFLLNVSPQIQQVIESKVDIHILSGSITIIKPQLGATNGNLSNLELSLAVGVIVGSD
jgi:DNA/RNA endonuclease G (NUC1)